MTMKKKLTYILISIVILCSLVLSAFSVGAVQNTNSGLAQSSSKTQRSVLIGDIDNDGRVNVADILSLKNLIMTDQWSDEQLIRGDIDGNGTLNVSDILSVKNIIMKLVGPDLTVQRDADAVLRQHIRLAAIFDHRFRPVMLTV